MSMPRQPKPQNVWDELSATLGHPGKQPAWKRWGGRALMLAMVLGLVVGLGALWQAGLLNAPSQSQARPGTRSVAELSPAAVIEQRIRAAQDFMRQGDTDRAAATLAAAVAEYRDDQDLRVAYGEALLHQDKTPEAYEQFVAALSIGPREPALDFAAGSLARRIGRPQLALEHFSAAQAADPTNPDYPLYLGQTQMSLGDLTPAKANLVRATLLREGDARPWGMLAEIALQENVADIALQHITRARALEPSQPAWKVIEARAMKRKGEAAQALKLLRSMNDSDRRTKPVARLMAECHGMLREPDIAAAIMVEAADAAPDDAELAYEAAVWLERRGDREHALPYAERAAAAGIEGADNLIERLTTRR
jgi:tetratricopeptide (TPR) repeat protein